MMIVDLIDEVDFIEKLKNIGVPVTDGMMMSEVQESLHSWMQSYPEQCPFVMALFEEMKDPKITVLPDVRLVIDTITRMLITK